MDICQNGLLVHTALDSLVNTLSNPNIDGVLSYQAKMDFLESIHKEIEEQHGSKPQPGDDWEPNEAMEFKYLEPYNLGTL